MSIIYKIPWKKYGIDTTACSLKEFTIKLDIYDPFTNPCNTRRQSLKNFGELFWEQSQEEPLFTGEAQSAESMWICFRWAVLKVELYNKKQNVYALLL